MMRILAFSCLFIFSCRDKNSIPDGILNQSKMEAILWDVVRADEMVTYSVLKDSLIKIPVRSAELYNKIFKLHGVKKEVFDKSMQFYQLRPDLLQPVLDSLKNSSERNILRPQTAQ